MAPLRVRIYPDAALRKRAKEVRTVGAEEKQLLEFMGKTMYATKGIGLAAPQVGISKRLIVLDAGDGLLKIANPDIIEKSKSASPFEEGCLSIPGKLVEVRRPERITISFTNEDGKRIKKSFSGLAAKAMQHEIDHLDGKLIIDYLPWYKRAFPKKGTVKCPQ
ncbi:MAG: peptide deformylase [Omnitrophica bacterium]|nr:peptide deformylase [Candidatus Omnitrophota bacterium]